MLEELGGGGREGSLFFSCIPKDLINTYVSCLTTVSGDRELPGSSMAAGGGTSPALSSVPT